MAIERFKEGDPLDISNLNAMYEELNNLLAAEKLRKTNAGVDNSTVKAYEPQLWAGGTKRTLSVKQKTIKTVTINYPGAKFGGIPRVTVTPVFDQDPPGDKTFFYKVANVTETQAIIEYWSTNWDASNIGFDYHLVWMRPIS